MVCHGELVRLKPEPRYLTSFYLVISAGGAAGGLFVGLIAPYVFPIYLEMHLALFGVWALMMLVFFGDRNGLLHAGRPRWIWGGLLLGVFALAGVLKTQANADLQNAVEVSRNFYGVLRVQEKDADDPEQHRLRLVHGRIVHGLQFVAEHKRLEPTTYYGRNSAVGTVLQNRPPNEAQHVGVVGLGIGTVATYAREGDHFRFYEINPEVTRLARKHFTYLEACKGKVDVVTGDARLLLEQESPQRFDILVVDAFSGDAIPAHLLTREAFEVYRRHMVKNGVLAFHISNLYFDLRPVLAAAAERLNWQGVVVISPGSLSKGTKPAIWVVMASNLDRPEFRSLHEQGEVLDGPQLEWTDTRGSLVRVLK